MTYTVEVRDEGVVVRLRGSVAGGPDAARFYDALRAIRAEGHSHVVLDLSGVTRMDGAGLGVLVGGLALVRNAGGEMYWAALPDHVHSLLVITRLHAALPCFDSVAEALEARSVAPSP